MNSTANFNHSDMISDDETALDAVYSLQTCIKENNEDNEEVDKLINKIRDSLFAEKQQIKQLEEKIEGKENTIKELKKTNSNLREQALKYQSMSRATADQSEDKNYSVQLKNDILRLQDLLEIYVTNLRPNIEVNFENIKYLLKKYKSKTRLSSRFIDNVPLIKAVLQRHVLETIFGYVPTYNNFRNYGKSYSLEAQIAHKADELILLTKEFAKVREGNDNITPAVPIKIRQQVYSALGNRGFSYIVNKQQTHEYDFINYFKTELNKEMEKYRKILNVAKKKEIEDKAVNIILDVIKIFRFKIRSREPIIQFRFFQYKDKIDPGLMIGAWNDGVDNFEVDICKFPLIGVELDDDLKRKIYTHALIHHREVVDSEVGSEMGLEVNLQVKKDKGSEKNDHKSIVFFISFIFCIYLSSGQTILFLFFAIIFTPILLSDNPSLEDSSNEKLL